VGAGGQGQPAAAQVALLTGGLDKPYAFGLSLALAAQGICLEVIGSDEIDSPEMHTCPNLHFLNLRNVRRANATAAGKAWRTLAYYGRLLRYTATAKPKIFHILWNNKFQLFDRTLLMLYYKLWGKKVVFTAHNVNAGRRDAKDGPLNRWSLKMQYRLADQIFVHTEKMQQELRQHFGVRPQAITVIPFGINNAVPNTSLTPAEAKRKLGILPGERTILFFGNIGPYKGLEFLVAAFQKIALRHPDYRLLIVGKVRGDGASYWEEIRRAVEKHSSRERVTLRIEFVPDQETELYFKAADALVLPYTQVSQSGVLFLGYSFGLPVIATDVGSLSDDVVAGHTGFLCQACNPADLARAIEAYFASDLYRNLDRRRRDIREYAHARHSWEVVGEMTRAVYGGLLGGQPA
jgi:D-inositol-3-phosphate glycosyltransferase